MHYTSTQDGITVTIEDGVDELLARRARCDCPAGCPDCEGVEE